jgi:hypothetical protein
MTRWAIYKLTANGSFWPDEIEVMTAAVRSTPRKQTCAVQLAMSALGQKRASDGRFRGAVESSASIAVGLLLVIAGQNFGSDPTRQLPDKHRGAARTKALKVIKYY